MDSIEEASQKQYELWNNFENNILHINRYFCNDQKFITTLDQVINNCEIEINKDSVLYRARIYMEDVDFIEEHKKNIKQEDLAEANLEGKESETYKIYKKLIEATKKQKRDWATRQESGYWGYDLFGSYIPPDAEKIPDGRANPSKIRYLYMSDDPNTALAEVRPIIKDYVSIAEIKTNEKLKIADFSIDSILKNKKEQMFFYLVYEAFSKPNNNDRFQYIPTQYISEYVKSIGFDGIKYSSSLYQRGRNYVVFSCDKCVPLSSKLYQIHDICYDAIGVAPFATEPYDYSYDLYHWRLHTQKENESRDMNELMKAYREYFERDK